MEVSLYRTSIAFEKLIFRLYFLYNCAENEILFQLIYIVVLWLWFTCYVGGRPN